jgi:4-hydroxy-3-polyprenylbenzoate decarboxylase
MGYHSLQHAVADLEKNGELLRIKQQVDPHLEMAAIHRRVFQTSGPAILFENVKGSTFPALSNLFGTIDRARFLFRDGLSKVQLAIQLKKDPRALLQDPLRIPINGWNLSKALPRKVRGGANLGQTCKISDLPQIQSWPMDGGPFVTLPQVYSEDPSEPGLMQSNLGMYRVQLGGNEYVQDQEIGLHYQIHRGIGVHQTKALEKGEDLKVSIFVGGPPAHSLAAVMPLPEGISELTFAGLLCGRRFRVAYPDGFPVAVDADFVITGTIKRGNKPEGPFGDHLGYYSLRHEFPCLQVHKVYHKKDAIWPFTIVGRPPQEDSIFGEMIHEMTGDAIKDELPGVHAVNAVDESGVHPLLLAIGSERYTPYQKTKEPSELLTQANRILGTGQLSLAKYLFITEKSDAPDIHDIPAFFNHVLRRLNFQRDLHFQTRTSIDTLDYSGVGINKGSKVVFASCGDAIRELANEWPIADSIPGVKSVHMLAPGIACLELSSWQNREDSLHKIAELNKALEPYRDQLKSVPWITICDDAEFCARNYANWLWVTFTRSNPSHDIYGLRQRFEDKHWACDAPLMIDARIKSHHAPALVEDDQIEARVDELSKKGGPLYGYV